MDFHNNEKMVDFFNNIDRIIMDTYKTKLNSYFTLNKHKSKVNERFIG